MKQPFTIYRVIRIDGQFDPDRIDNAEQLVAETMAKVINDANAHNHTIENSIEITEITDCGDSN